ncbi:MAG: glycosyltransferase family 39 protein [Planctomycetes bacterium]|nr:glycosyltransferase family 39 protein [Planctomycetota bacterium]
MLLLLLAAAAWLRLRALDFGLPFPFAAIDEHIVTDHAIAFVGGDLNPRYFAYPSGGFALHALAYLAAYAVGPFDSRAAFADAFWIAPQSLLLLSRALTAAIALATVLLMARLGAELARAAGLHRARRPAAWLAAAALAASFLHASNSRWVTVDIPMVAAATLGLTLSLRHLRRGGTRSLLLSAAAIGLAAGFKYYGAWFALALGLAVVARARREAGPARARALRRLLLAAAVTIAAFLATSPYVLLDFATFRRDFETLQQHMAGGHFGHDPTRSGLAVYAGHLVAPWVGPWLLLPAALGLLVAAGRRPGRMALLCVLLPALAQFSLIVRFKAQPVDYLLGLLPALCALAGLAAAALHAGLARTRSRAVPIGALLLLAAPLSLGARHAYDEATWRGRPDTRVAARAWIEQQVPAGALIAADTWLDLPLTLQCLERMREARARELLLAPGETPAEIPLRRPRDEPLAALDAKLRVARARPPDDPTPTYDFGYITPIELALRDELFPLLREHGARWLLLDGTRMARAERTGGAQRELADWYRRHLEGPLVANRFDPASGRFSGPPLTVIDLERWRADDGG